MPHLTILYLRSIEHIISGSKLPSLHVDVLMSRGMYPSSHCSDTTAPWTIGSITAESVGDVLFGKLQPAIS